MITKEQYNEAMKIVKEYRRQLYLKIDEINDDEIGLQTKLSSFEFSVRVSNCLRDAELETIKDLIFFVPKLSQLRNFGMRSLTEIGEFIEKLDFIPTELKETLLQSISKQRRQYCL